MKFLFLINIVECDVIVEEDFCFIVNGKRKSLEIGMVNFKKMKILGIILLIILYVKLFVFWEISKKFWL